MSSAKTISEKAFRRIVCLLAATEMTAAEIAERMSCARGTVLAVNRRFQIRAYSGLRTHWCTGSPTESDGEKRAAYVRRSQRRDLSKISTGEYDFRQTNPYS